MADPTLKERLSEEMKDAMRAGEKIRLGALRMLSAAITNREKEVGHELSDDEVREVAGREVKRRNESIEAFEKGGRTDLVDKETSERSVVEPYAPGELSEAEVDAMIDEAIAQTGAMSAKEMGRVMGVVMGRAKGRVDGSVVQAKVRERLDG